MCSQFVRQYNPRVFTLQSSSDRTEFGHPDLAITLTLRTYAEDGLTRESFRRVLQWAAAIEDDLQTGAVHKAVAKRLKIARAAEGFTLDDEMIDLLWPKLCQNLQVVETFLEEFVFPNETRQFPFKAHCCMKGPR